MSRHSKDSEMQKFEELLTPYVQGRLDEATRRTVEQYAETSRDFAELLDFEQQVAVSIKSSPEDSVVVMPSIQKLKQRIDSQSKRNRSVEIFLAWIRDAFDSLNPKLVAASLAVVTIAVLALQQPIFGPVDEGFETLSSTGNDVGTPDRRYFSVVFDESMDASSIEQLSAEFGFLVETGPNSIGAYTVSIEAGDEASEAAAAAWRADERFVFVGPTRASKTP